MAFRIVADKVAAPKFKQNLAGLKDRFDKAFSAAMNMAASMIKQRGDADIKGAGNFGSRWTEGLHVDVTDTRGRMQIVLTHDIPYAGIFENGGQIAGNPMLWIPLSFSDAKGIPPSEYGGGLFSVTRRDGGAPLLFSIADKQPKYFGIESVTIPQKFHLGDIQKSVMGNFRQIFDTAFRASE
jgi:hypothetical protein